MRNIRCDEILNREEFSKISEKDFEIQVENYLIDKLNEYETTPSKNITLQEKPTKSYEVFNLIFESLYNETKVFVLDTNLINYNDDKDESELYYSRIIAKRICENLKILNEDAINGIPELENEFKDDIDLVKQKIEELRELDENEFNLDLFASIALEDTEISKHIDTLQTENVNLVQENIILKENLKKSEEQIIDLSNKLKISLDSIEKNREHLELHTQSRFEKFLARIKKIINNE